MELKFDPQYRFPAGPGTPLPSNLVEQVVPKWFW